MYTKKYIINSECPFLKVDEKYVGGKGYNLFQLKHYAMHVPDWFVISTKLNDKYINRMKSVIDDAIESINFENYSSIEAASSQISSFITELDITGNVEKEIIQTTDRLKKNSGLFAVRSSLVGEDAGDISFAGQMDSFLCVPTVNLISSMLKVWASAYSPRALVYRHKKNLSLSDVHMAVIIQVMIDAKCSGVLFTRDPDTVTDRTIISSAFGLGEGVVQGTAETDCYYIDNQNPDLQETVKFNSGCDPVLTKKQVKELFTVGKQIEVYYNQPLDIEWSYDCKGRLHLLQVRPMTTQGNDRQQKMKIWDNANIVESYPGFTLPLTYSFIRQCYEASFRNASLGFLLMKKDIQNDMHIFSDMVSLLNGRVYYNLLNWYKMMSYLPNFSTYKKIWDQMIGINQSSEFAVSRISTVNKVYSWIKIIILLLSGKRTTKQFLSWFNNNYESCKKVDFTQQNEDELIESYRMIGYAFSSKWHLTLYNDYCAIKYFDWLRRLCEHWIQTENNNIHHDLLCGQNIMESVKPLKALLRISVQIHNNKSYHTLFCDPDNKIIWAKLQSNRCYEPLKIVIDDYVAEYGDRAIEELKLENQTFRESPEQLVKILKAYCKNDLSFESITSDEDQVIQRAEDVVKRHLKNPLKRFIFAFVLRYTRVAIANRETMRLCRSRLFGLVRNLFIHFAEIFLKQGIIKKQDDIYFLTIEEIFDYINGSSIHSNLQTLIDLRKKEYASYRTTSNPDRIVLNGIPYPHLQPDDNTSTITSSKHLKGIGCTSGTIEGKAKIVSNPKEFISDKNYILVAQSTDPGWIFLMVQAKGIVIERGSILSHSAIIGRELGIPTVVSVKNATRRIKDGDYIRINGKTGEVICL
jgi:pyruvate,water dikinase